jgi:D-alanyl-D-alanine carboxypeptidase
MPSLRKSLVGAVLAAAIATMTTPASTGATAPAHPLQALADALVARDPVVPSVVIRAVSPSAGIDWSASAAGAREGGLRPLVDRPFRIASVTKLFVGAALLRLVEEDQIGLDAPLPGLVSPSTEASLRRGGHDAARITLRQLLAHTSGLPDHSQLPAYGAAVTANLQRRWERDEQIAFGMEGTRPTGKPGESWSYSDTGYVILGEVIERHTGLSLAAALRSLLPLDQLGLRDTWLETLESSPRPGGSPPRLAQYLGYLDVTGADPSFDLWGGGGLVSTVDDLTRFMRALLGGKVFRHLSTLQLAMSAPRPVASGADLKHGLIFFHDRIAGHACISHAGFWNVDLVACPDLDLVVALSLNQSMTAKADERRQLLAAIVDAVAKSR